MENIDNIIRFLSGKRKNIIKELKKEMKTYAQSEDFEKASILRDKIHDLEYISQKIEISPFEGEKEYIYSRYEKIKASIEQIEKKLNTGEINRIECYDVSNIRGQFAYGAMSVAIDSRLKNDHYRIFKIKDSTDDISMLKNVIARRLRHIGEDTADDSLFSKPDLILIDGGKGQLSALSKIIPSDIALLAISKGKHLKKKGSKIKDEFWISKEGGFERLNINYPYLFTHLRDEAHRFGVKHYRKNISKYSQNSVLDKIEGVGSKRRKMLLKEFKTVAKLKKASIQDIDAVIKNKTVSKKIYLYFHN